VYEWRVIQTQSASRLTEDSYKHYATGRDGSALSWVSDLPGGALALVADHMALVTVFDCRAMESHPDVVHRIGVVAGGNNGISFFDRV
jgi:hypothetical protein